MVDDQPGEGRFVAHHPAVQGLGIGKHPRCDGARHEEAEHATGIASHPHRLAKIERDQCRRTRAARPRGRPNRHAIGVALNEDMEIKAASVVGRDASERALEHHGLRAAIGEGEVADAIALDLRPKRSCNIRPGRQHVDDVTDTLAPGQKLPVRRKGIDVEMAICHATCRQWFSAGPVCVRGHSVVCVCVCAAAAIVSDNRSGKAFIM
ncbi:hypothetical protein LMG27952_07659 [Paraburkholderia hiiakae]|uniref:Uncharacterized protein n=1 Tax=Paraburkholderia hiiakae TaxID=1081782 RepID=A0ABN7IFX0_9BURK|nr:hypothetical protein LMG27952_07659 [Paraburkholderia hiiakae]